MICYNLTDPAPKTAAQLLVKYFAPMQLSTHLLQHSLAVVLGFHALSLLCQDNFEPQTCFPTEFCVICKCMSGITDAITEQHQSTKTSGRALFASLYFVIELILSVDAEHVLYTPSSDFIQTVFLLLVYKNVM